MTMGLSGRMAAACLLSLAAAAAGAGDLPAPGTLMEGCYVTAEEAAVAAMRETYALGDDLLFSGTVQITADGCYRYSVPVAQALEGQMYFPPALDGRRLVAVYFTTRETPGPALRHAHQKIADGLKVQVYMGLASSKVTESATPSGS
jgi:hypothetical protein